MISLPLQGSCRTTKGSVGTSVAVRDDMKKRKINSVTFLLLLVVLVPVSLFAQEKQGISRNALARMDVLSRARLFEATIQKAAKTESVDPLILWTIAYNETRFRPWLTSPKNAQGLMQFMPATAVRFGLSNPYEPTASIHAAAKYVKYLGRLFDWKLESVLAAYNAGEGTVSAYLSGRELKANGRLINASRVKTADGIPPYKETQGYVSQGVKVYRWLQRQGRLGMPSTSFEAQQKTSIEKIVRSPEVQEMPILSVLYDPRTGKRSLISPARSTQPYQLDFGPILVGPTIPRNSTQRARSTFIGESNSSEPNK